MLRGDGDGDAGGTITPLGKAGGAVTTPEGDGDAEAGGILATAGGLGEKIISDCETPARLTSRSAPRSRTDCTNAEEAVSSINTVARNWESTSLVVPFCEATLAFEVF